MTTSPVPFTPLLCRGCPVCVPAPRGRSGIGNTQGFSGTGGHTSISTTYRAAALHACMVWLGHTGLDITVGSWEEIPLHIRVFCLLCFFLSFSLSFLLLRTLGYVVCPSWICGILTARRFACTHRAATRFGAEVVMRRGDIPPHGMAWHDWKKGTRGVIGFSLDRERWAFSLFFLLRGSSLSGYFFLRFATAAPVDHAMSISHGYDGEQETEGSSWSIEGCGLGEEEEESAFVGGCVSLVEHPGRTDGRGTGPGRPACGFECFLFILCCLIMFVVGACDGVF